MNFLGTVKDYEQIRTYANTSITVTQKIQVILWQRNPQGF